MAKRIAQFHKVSFGQFKEGYQDVFGSAAGDDEIQMVYDGIRLPCRATSGSAGYDFYAPVEITMEPGETVKIPTGICVELERVKENHMVTGILTTGSTANVKIIAETKPFPQARPVQPDVEDAYMYLMNS